MCPSCQLPSPCFPTCSGPRGTDSWVCMVGPFALLVQPQGAPADQRREEGDLGIGSRPLLVWSPQAMSFDCKSPLLLGPLLASLCLQAQGTTPSSGIWAGGSNNFAVPSPECCPCGVPTLSTGPSTWESPDRVTEGREGTKPGQKGWGLLLFCGQILIAE